MEKKMLSGLATGLLLVGAVGVANANLIKNGSFESPDIAAGTASVITTMDGWNTVSGMGADVRDGVGGDAYDGDQFIELDGYSNSAIEQFVDTVRGERYTLSLAYAPQKGVTDESNAIAIYWGGIYLMTLKGESTRDNYWNYYDIPLFAFGETSSLRFGAIGTSDGYGGYLDAISLTGASVTPGPGPQPSPVPEPATMVLLGSGLAALSGARLRRKK